MDAIVTAGGIPQPGESLYEFTQGGPKALLDVAGKPMIQWVLDALSGAPSVDRVVIIGLPEESNLVCSKHVTFVPNQGGMLENVRAGMQKVLDLNPQAHHVLTVSSDIPAVTSEMVTWMVETVSGSDHDIYYCVITRQVMEARYPNSKRSYTRLKDAEVCGGDMNVVRALTAATNEALWEKIVAARKNVLKQASLIGYDTLLMLVFRRLTIQQAEKIASQRLDISGKVVLCPYAEIGMDVDKPHQLEIVRADLAAKVPA
jgi:molybdopterin-guanine dinucleotide biosynthesis protein A